MKKDGTSRRRFIKSAVFSGAALGAMSHLSPALAGEGDKSPGEGAKPSPLVPRRPLGTTGETVPILLVGCAQRFDPKYDKILHRAFKDGVNYLDTALAYEGGQSHRTIAPFIKQIGDRKKLWITSKSPSDDATVETYSRDLDKCLEQLETNYLDLFFMHWVHDEKYLEPEYIKMGERLKKSGKTRFFGFSCHHGNVAEMLAKAAKVGGIDAIMFRYNFRKYGDLELNRAIDACKKAGIGLIAMKTQDSVPPDLEQVVGFKSKDFTLAQAKLKAVWADERIDAAVSHMDNTAKLAENVAAAKSPVQLSMNEIQQLRAIATATSRYACQGCSHLCERAAGGGVRIADQLRFLMYYESYGERDKARRLYRELPGNARNLTRADLGAAAKVCPMGIDIAARLGRARDMLAV